MERGRRLMLVAFLVLSTCAVAQKKPLTLDDFFNSVSITAVEISPDGKSVVIGAEHADWEQNRFRRDLWLYRDDAKPETLVQLTQSGEDGKPKWSPDGRWIAFLSERKVTAAKDGEAETKDEPTSQIYLIAADGGEAFPVTRGHEEVHAFCWSPDSKTLYFATRTPWSKAQNDAYKKDWKDVIQYRRAERGDEVFILSVDDALRNRKAEGTNPAAAPEPASVTPGAHSAGSLAYRISALEVSPDGARLALASSPVSERMEIYGEYELYVVDLATAGPEKTPRRITHNEGIENDIRWAADNRRLLFHVGLGSAEGKYKDAQERLYSVDVETGDLQRWAANYDGSVQHYANAGEGVIATGNSGTEIQLYAQGGPKGSLAKLAGWPGTYGSLSTATGSPRIAFEYSSLQRPTEVYLAESVDKLRDAKAITSFNKLFTERDLPQGKPYRWKADDGTMVEGMLVYPPGKFEAKNLRMLVLIHGGPADADGDHFEADWYQWSGLAATQGWLVFQPNYRGSTGYGDKFLEQIVPQIVSRPGKDILEGVDALVKDGIADPAHLAIAGYSYGGYMTNWLITQTIRFKAAMTGAGAVEHVANWGNDDMTFDDAYFLGGRPWEAPQQYRDEAAIFQINKVRTPTHIVAGNADIRVPTLENYLLDHALHALGVPSTLLLFPGEGHGLGKNPWHGKIKVREELKWLEKYAGSGAAQ
jgi:dipeptidyl aminopeptidase/acylaminoacyl peptidase